MSDPNLNPKPKPRRSKPIQKSLANYLKRPKNDHIPRYFHYDGHQALFLSHPPQTPHTEISQVKWKYTKKYLVLTSTPDLLQSKKFTQRPTYPEHELIHKSTRDQWTPKEEIEIIAILKSHLQKAVRLGQTQLALSTVNYLATLAPIELLRRIPIIMIEDVHLQHSFTLLIWVMVYYSTIPIESRTLSLYWRNFLNQIITDLCQSNYQDDFHQSPPSSPLLTDVTKSTTLTETQKSIILALQLRKSYGGMHCDQRMLDSITLQWYQRFTNLDPHPDQKFSAASLLNSSFRPSDITLNPNPKQTTTQNNPNNPQTNHPHPQPLTNEHFINAAIDFHPCPWLLTEIVKKHPNLKSDEVKTAIWQCRSSINLRNDRSPSENSINIWSQIQDQVSEFIKEKKAWLFELLNEMEDITLTSDDTSN